MKKINSDVMPDVNIATFASALPAHVPEQEDAKDLPGHSKLTEFIKESAAVESSATAN